MKGKPTLRGKWDNVFSGNQMDNVRKDPSCTFSHDKLASGNSGSGQRRKGRSIVFSSTKFEGQD